VAYLAPDPQIRWFVIGGVTVKVVDRQEVKTITVYVVKVSFLATILALVASLLYGPPGDLPPVCGI
jgi:hypothetical protein